jgi:hypothetical protein
MGQPVIIRTPMPTLAEIATRLGISEKTQKFINNLVNGKTSARATKSNGRSTHSVALGSAGLKTSAKRSPAKKTSTRKAKSTISPVRKSAVKKRAT